MRSWNPKKKQLEAQLQQFLNATPIAESVQESTNFTCLDDRLHTLERILEEGILIHQKQCLSDLSDKILQLEWWTGYEPPSSFPEGHEAEGYEPSPQQPGWDQIPSPEPQPPNSVEQQPSVKLAQGTVGFYKGGWVKGCRCGQERMEMLVGLFQIFKCR